MSLKRAKLELWIVIGILIFLATGLLWAASVAREIAARVVYLILGIPCLALAVINYVNRSNSYIWQGLSFLQAGNTKAGFASLDIAIKLNPKSSYAYVLCT